jgi:phosphoadenylyl-sulfate reductase (thioredoxin)
LGTSPQVENTRPEELIGWAVRRFRDQFAVVTSFQREGMVIVDMAARIAPEVRVITIDTGRLPEATHEMIRRVERHYRIQVEVAAPDPAEVAAMTARHGMDLFREDVALRMLCCQVRKVRPLERVANLRAYAVGLRREQSETRAEVAQVDEAGGRTKISPLAHWTAEDVRHYIASHDVPEHPLYAAGYSTIGCDPCTRAVAADEDERAGRWWWETDASKECGLHFAADGRVLRRVDVLLEELLSARHA